MEVKVLNTLYKTINLFSRTEKNKALIVLGLVFFMAIMETFSIVSIMPFLAVLSNPEAIEENTILTYLYNYLSSAGIISNHIEFLVFLGFFIMFVVVFSSFYKAFAFYKMNKFIEGCRNVLSQKLLKKYLNKEYQFFLGRHSGDISKTILSEVDHIVANVISPSFMMFAYGLVFISITILLFVIDIKLALFTAGILILLYAIIFSKLRNKFSKLGEDIVKSNKRRFMIVNEVLTGIKYVKFTNSESLYTDLFNAPSTRYADVQALQKSMYMIPYFVIEAFIFGGMLFLTNLLLLQSSDGSLGGALPILGLYAFSLYRLKPAGQHIYHGFSNLRYGSAAVESIYGEIYSKDEKIEENNKIIQFNESISVSNISYQYPTSKSVTLQEISLNIARGSKIGFMGSTGSGKTTLVDIISGLLTPTSGYIKIDGIPIVSQGDRAALRNLIGYVSQDIILIDDSIAANIAFGYLDIDMDRVIKCAKIANIHNTIKNNFDLGYLTLVGERGVRLSGGERQRIGIARALYGNPPILIFDEATSALDGLTERAIIQEFSSLAADKTMLIIAHRLSTILDCDQIVFLENGRIRSNGTFKELKASDDVFNKMTIGSSNIKNP
jgi:ATP-binding cassette, subfamily B, bacterial PglK